MTETAKPFVFRIAPPAEMEDDLNKLTFPQPGRAFPLFASKQKALMFAAALGFHRRLRHEEPFKRGTAIRLEVFQQQLDDRFLDVLAIAVSDDLRVLSPGNAAERVKIFEEYAYSGLKEMVERCIDSNEDPLKALLHLTEGVRDERRPDAGNVDPQILQALTNF